MGMPSAVFFHVIVGGKLSKVSGFRGPRQCKPNPVSMKPSAGHCTVQEYTV
ncbi:hypothetical protein PhaeoP23_03802 (plasmid) [Phaeobacter piscinae]|uniref:Uncharacterized protein n=1 Tax=Phaeobacter piscinae TaxID=1580596 RepID=A0ABM6PJ64_9RHOB|nr:hypothetical protein PhaeoP36_03802 [Phaeobacter piscinae]AUQ88399.1 hypothetical protein PhaeoP42_03803 [Phaeobacter piscinae]AUR26282.1 hypothetical protein PhaeoP23_03802 [Phaeobacter piscinae]